MTLEDDEDMSALLFCDPTLPARVVQRIEAELSKDGAQSGNSAAEGCGIGCFCALLISAALAAIGLDSGVGAVIVIITWIGIAVAVTGNKSSTHTAKRYADRYVDAEDLDGISLRLMSRVVDAIHAIQTSRVSSEGLLDGMANDVVLPQQMWEMAKVLKRQTELRAEQAKADESLMTDELAAVLAPQRAALKKSVNAVKQRIERLEAYAKQVRAADSALEARDRIKDNEKYRELLAHTDDEAAVASLDAQATEIEETLRSNIQKALAAGEALAT